MTEINLRDFTILGEDVQDAVDIENYLESLKMKRLDLLAHWDFCEAMEGMIDTPIQDWEYGISSRFRVWC
tara:strand:+ start:947 stop:1156 length:210 start_codon:yes stop_codon:yes gene_type:complete